MARIYRSMFADGDKPMVGRSATSLGVRIPPDHHPDIVPDAQGIVHPQTGGMSVAPAWRFLPYFRISERLKAKVPGARGNPALVCWRIGDGPFEECGISPQLLFRPDPKDPKNHGLVEPAVGMNASAYQAALHATRGHWVRDED